MRIEDSRRQADQHAGQHRRRQDGGETLGQRQLVSRKALGHDLQVKRCRDTQKHGNHPQRERGHQDYVPDQRLGIALLVTNTQTYVRRHQDRRDRRAQQRNEVEALRETGLRERDADCADGVSRTRR